MKHLKKAISLFLTMAIISSCFGVSAIHISVENQIQAIVDEKMEIILPQLQAQNALAHAEMYEEIIYAMVVEEFRNQSGISPLEDGTENNVYAPRGGMVAYKVPRAGFPPQRMLAIGCTDEQAAYWTNKVNNQTSVLDLLLSVFSFADELDILSFLPDYIAEVSEIFFHLALYGNRSILEDIERCNGRVLVINTYWSIDNSASVAVMGWGSMSIPVPYNALEITPHVN